MGVPYTPSFSGRELLPALQHWKQQKRLEVFPKTCRRSGAEQGTECTLPGIPKAEDETLLAILLQSSNHLVRMLSTFSTRVISPGTSALILQHLFWEGEQAKNVTTGVHVLGSVTTTSGTCFPFVYSLVIVTSAVINSANLWGCPQFYLRAANKGG